MMLLKLKLKPRLKLASSKKQTKASSGLELNKFKNKYGSANAHGKLHKRLYCTEKYSLPTR